MQGTSKTLIAVVAVLAAAVAVAFGVRKGCRTSVKEPDRVREQPIEKIDIESLEIVALPAYKWRDLGSEGSKFRNPSTKKYTMVNVAVCGACGQKIPHPEHLFVPIPRERGKHSIEEINRMIDEAIAQQAQVLKTYECPKCHKKGTVGESAPKPSGVAPGVPGPAGRGGYGPSGPPAGKN